MSSISYEILDEGECKNDDGGHDNESKNSVTMN